MSLSLIASAERTAGASGNPLYSGFLGRVLQLAGVEDEVDFVHQLSVDTVEHEGESRPVTAWRVDTGTGSLIAFSMPFEGNTLTGVVTGLDRAEDGGWDTSQLVLSTWLLGGTEPDGLVLERALDIPVVSLAAGGPGCALIGSVIGDGVAAKVPACTAHLFVFLACSAGSYFIADVACNSTPGSWADGATCTSRGIRWWSTYADPAGTSFCAYEDRAGSNFMMVRAFELLPTNCYNPASLDCQGLNASGQLVTRATNWRLTTLWPDGMVVQNEYFGTTANYPRDHVDYRWANLPRGTYRMVIRAQETVDVVGWSETGKIQSLWSLR